MRDGSTAALEGLLPGLFADLEPWLDQWALATEQQRFDKRVSLTMDELRPFYEAMLDRMPTIMDHLAKLPIDGLSSEDDKDRKSTRLNSSHKCAPRMPSSS